MQLHNANVKSLRRDNFPIIFVGMLILRQEAQASARNSWHKAKLWLMRLMRQASLKKFDIQALQLRRLSLLGLSHMTKCAQGLRATFCFAGILLDTQVRMQLPWSFCRCSVARIIPGDCKGSASGQMVVHHQLSKISCRRQTRLGTACILVKAGSLTRSSITTDGHVKHGRRQKAQAQGWCTEKHLQRTESNSSLACLLARADLHKWYICGFKMLDFFLN